ncbi:hypothetical protein Bca52824_005424 [Brassica carinata]|uniref:Uncharacterized protein n=1 Tax=Brassica carinata TaxID=52824 RepID=A0A8X7WNH2_BRACI|nr:hypothetical protein Bca52824_005424 [Brassica carinata]
MIDRAHWIDKAKLVKFILDCQDTENGGISDRPDDAVDIFPHLLWSCRDTEATMIKKIATDISNMLNNFTPSNDFDGLVGMGAHLKKLEPLLRLGSDEVRMIGIWGPPGIGKTTIARFTYNQISANFQLSVFMDDLKANAKLQLQQQFMSQITNHKDMVVSHLGQRDLVVWSGSRIIITSQDQKIFRAHGVNHIYKVNFPTIDEALQIFCTYSFGQNSPKDGFEELAREVTKFAGGLPLGLKVMGSYFRGMAKQEWINSLPRLRTSLDADIRNILKFSYDALDDEDKDLFLHIACFFNSERIHKVEEYLAKKFLEVRQRLNALAEKSLISTDWGVVRMHSLLEKLGREIVCKQSIHEPGQRQFLYDKREICDVLSGDATGSKSVIGIKLEYGREGEEIDISEKAFEGMSNLQFLRVYGDSDTLQLTRGLNYLPHKLRLLEWSHFPMSCFPCNVNLEFLVELVMDHSKLEKWEGIKSLRSLKWMNLSDSVNLKELPDLSTATNLEKLNLHNCSSLIKLPSLPGTSLEEFDISGCSSLVDFPSCIGNAINLRELDLSCLPNLVELPSYIWNATNLEKLDLSNCMNLVELPLSLGNFTKLEILILKGCSKLEVLPTNIILKSLKKLDLAGCSSLDLARCSIFENPVILQDISGCSSLVDFPSCIGNAVNLRILDLSGCSNLVELPSYIWNATNLEKLDLSNCLNLVELPLSLGNLKKLERLILKGCSKLEVLPTNIILKSLKKLDLARCSSLDLARCSIFKNPVILRELDLSSLPNMVELPSYICNATNLETLDLSNCLNLVELPLLLGNLKKLERLILKGCSKLEVFPTNIILKSLKKLDLAGCSSLDLAGCSTIVNFLDLSGCSNLVELPLFIGNLQKLQRLRLRGCRKLEVLPTNINLESLDVLNLGECSMLKSFPQISTNIRDLDLRGTAIEQVPLSIMSWPRLDELKMSYFENLKEFPHVLERITGLWLTDTEIQDVPPLVKEISRLNQFFLKGCRKLVSVPRISDSIHSIFASDCESLEILECSFPDPKVWLYFANCFKLNQEARDLIIQTNSRYAVLPGTQVPAYFTHRATGGGPLTIKLNEKPLPISTRFKACILLVDKGDHDACSEKKSMRVVVGCKHKTESLYPALAEHLYTFRVKAEVTSSELLSDFKLKSDDVWKIGECGLVQDLEIP